MTIKIGGGGGGTPGQKIDNEWNRLSPKYPGQPILKQHVDVIADRVSKAHAARKGKKNYDPIIGAVVGSVQSGKTATMIGLTGRLFAQGFDVVTILTGLRNDLRYQSARRFYRDLLDSGERTHEFVTAAKIAPVTPESYTHPKGDGNHGSVKLGPDFYVHLPLIQDMNHTTAANLRLNVKNQTPVLLFVKKISRKGGGTLGALKNALNLANNARTNSGLPPLRHAIIDDECDEATVGSSTKPAAPGAIREIVDIGHGAYIGFTATAQANIFVTGPTNPLRPQDFIELLRYTADYNVGLPKKQVAVNSGKNMVQYCGGFLFHEWNQARGQDDYFRQDLDLTESLVAYIVSGAIRLEQKKNATFPTSKQRSAGYLPHSFVLPDPHTMLIHTSHKIEDHWKAGEELIRDVHTSFKSKAHFSIGDADDAIKEWQNTKTLLKSSFKSSPKFKNWYDKYVVSTNSARIDSPGTEVVPPWKDVKKKIAEVIDNIDLRIVNSKTQDENLLYDTSDIMVGGKKQKSIPQDIYPIVISGNKMGRGITLDGLTTTYFDRHPKFKVQDTIIQRQRWFGYHGKRIGLVRIFCHKDEWATLRRINDDDEYLKLEIAKRRDIPPTDQKWSTFFTGGHALTRKIKKGSSTYVTFDFSPIREDYFRVINNPQSSKTIQKKNMAAFNQIFKDLVAKGMAPATGASTRLKDHYFLGKQFDSSGKKTKPVVNGSRLSALEVAEIMESFYIHGHNPDPTKSHLGDPKALGVQSGFKMEGKTAKRLPMFNKRWAQDYLHVALYLRWWATKHPANVPEFNVVVRNGRSKTAYTVPGTGFPINHSGTRLSKTVDAKPNSAFLHHGTMGSRGVGQLSDGRLDDMRASWPMKPASENGQADARKVGEPGLLILDLPLVGTEPTVRMSLVVPEGGPSVSIAVQL
jgi:hypothetical protein